ncbi:hypothetical protein [Acidisoma sp. S159]|uniref:hypothetical protein n=1 Tax=Acidisoma sp. S159 TaxID=1747225 RepID=UPI00131C84A9|nr:hypothetical protein [Acidisoma sp. S159]
MADVASNCSARIDLLDIEMTREMEAYLRRGRVDANLSDGELEGLWTAAFMAWFRNRAAEDSLGYYDLDVELELRCLEPPIEVVHSELARAHAQLSANMDGENPASNERLLTFLKAANDTSF